MADPLAREDGPGDDLGRAEPDNLPIIAVILNYVKRSDVAGTWLESHFRWQIRTFWFTFLWLIVYGLLIITIIGIPLAWIMIALLGLWVGYRVIRGWVALGDGRTVG